MNGGEAQYYGASDQAVNSYLQSFSKTRSAGHTNVLYEAASDTPASESAWICRVEMLDRDYQPKELTSTWDYLVVRVHYNAKESIQKGTFILDFFDYKQQRLIVLDSGMRIPIKPGRHYVDCRIPCLPLAAGKYFIGAGLTVSNYEWLWRNTNIATFYVHGKDVFALGRPPESKRMLFAVDHTWENPINQENRNE